MTEAVIQEPDEAATGAGPGGDGPRPSHHGPRGRFRNPWRGLPAEPGQLDVLRWMRERIRTPRAPDPDAHEVPRGTPELADPRLPETASEIRVTWIGHASFLVQLPGINLLTDPVFSDRASPVQWAGPRRFSDPGLTVAELPPIDLVVQSHDHYDHLDRGSVEALHERFGDEITWYTPVGYRGWYEARGVQRVVELDWWEEALGEVSVRALPARHWSSRRFLDARKRLWSAWRVEVAGRRLYFGGDSGYCSAFREVSEREAPFDVALLPIGAYEPRWFMRASHMNPEEAAQAYVDLGGAGAFVAMHWGTFRLTDEDPLEPPRRARAAWSALGLPAADLHVPAIGETLRL